MKRERLSGRYSPGDFVSAVKVPVMGNPVMETVSTSYVERQNLTMRMSMRRLTRLTNGFSKKGENMEKALAVHFAYYTFCRIHSSLRVTPAREARHNGSRLESEGITLRGWSSMKHALWFPVALLGTLGLYLLLGFVGRLLGW
jgi:hypothetical protein